MSLCRENPVTQEPINQSLKQFLRKDPPNLHKTYSVCWFAAWDHDTSRAGSICPRSAFF